MLQSDRSHCDWAAKNGNGAGKSAHLLGELCSSDGVCPVGDVVSRCRCHYSLGSVAAKATEASCVGSCRQCYIFRWCETWRQCWSFWWEDGAEASLWVQEERQKPESNEDKLCFPPVVDVSSCNVLLMHSSLFVLLTSLGVSVFVLFCYSGLIQRESKSSSLLPSHSMKRISVLKIDKGKSGGSELNSPDAAVRFSNSNLLYFIYF